PRACRAAAAPSTRRAAAAPPPATSWPLALAASTTGFPSPLWGGVRGGGNPGLRYSAIPPTLSLPHAFGARLRRDGGGDAYTEGGESHSGNRGHDADTASVRGARSAPARRCMRNTNSIASSRKATGSGASIHHSGVMRVLMVIALAS